VLEGAVGQTPQTVRSIGGVPTTNGASEPIPRCAQCQQSERPQTGTQIEPQDESSASSQLKIINGTSLDAAVRLSSQETSITTRFVYIRAGDQYTLENIESDTYILRFSSGHDWVPSCHDFLDSNYSEFERALVFDDAVHDDGRESYSVMTATLNPVIFGNIRKRAISRNRQPIIERSRPDHRQ